MSSAPRGLAPCEGLGSVLMNTGRAGPPFEPRRRSQAGKSGDPRSQNADKLAIHEDICMTLEIFNLAAKCARAEEGRLSLMELPEAEADDKKTKAKEAKRKGPAMLAVEPGVMAMDIMEDAVRTAQGDARRAAP